MAKGEIEMKEMIWLRLGLLVAFAVLFNACHVPDAPPYTPPGLPPRGQGLASPLPVPAQGQPQSPLAYTEPEILLLVDADSPDCVGVAGIDGYQMVRRTTIQLTQADGSIQPNIIEDLMLVTRTDGQDCNSHMAMAFVDPQTGERDAMNESYVVDDLVFAYCSMCPPPDSGVWRVNKRSTEPGPSASSGPTGPMPVPVPLGLTPIGIGPYEVDRLVAQSSVVGDEEMNGFATVHRRFTDRQMLSEAVGWLMGAASNYQLEVTTAQIDMWLTPDEGRLVRLLFQAEGKAPAGIGSEVLLPFALKEEFNFTAVARNTPIVVPGEVLAAVAEQLKALQGD